MIRFLKRLLAFLLGSRDPDRDLRGLIGDSENLARFLFSDKHFARTTSRVKRQAFDPPLNRQVSVFRIDRLSESAVWTLGRERVGAARNEAPRARADLVAAAVRATQLDAVAAPETHPRHANIVGWPDDKECVRQLTMELATRAKLRLPANT